MNRRLRAVLRRQRGLTLNFPTGSLSVAHDFDPAGRLQTVAAGAYSARYSYLANSPLVDTVSFEQGTATVMTTTRTYDNLNRLQTVSSVSSASSVVAFSYGYNDANQRARATLADGSYWIYDYDALGQVISGKRSWADGTPVAGQQFEYGFDDIGNRRTTKSGGDSSGGSLRSASYTSDSLNRYASRDVPGAVDVLGTAVTGASVSVNGVTVTSGRKGEYYQQTVPVGNSAAAQWVGVTVAATQNGLTETQNGNVFVPKTREVFGYDDDGNLTQDGRWRYTWDAENRLLRIEPATAVGPQLTLTFTYDALGRRIRKTVTGAGPAVDQRFVYDGWNLVAILSSDLRPLSSFVWGLDLSGSEQGAGGVGGLLAVLDVTNGIATGASYPAYDGNGNVMGLLNAGNGTWVAQYEYGPFGEPIRRTGSKAAANPFRFSTKYTDDETDLLYYGYRYYHPSLGRWLSRDPIAESGGMNLYAFVYNNALTYWDYLGNEPQSNLDLLKEELGDDAYDGTMCVKFANTATAALNETPIGQAKIAITGKGLTDKDVSGGEQAAAAIGLGFPLLKKGLQCCKAGYVCVKLRVIRVFSKAKGFSAADDVAKLIAGSGDNILLGVVDSNGVVRLFEAAAGRIEGHQDLIAKGLVDPKNLQGAFWVAVKKGEVQKLCTTSALNPASAGHNITDDAAKKVLDALEASGADFFRSN